MKSFIKNILLFSILPLFGLIILFSLNYDQEFAWNFVKGDCGIQGNWIFDRIHRDTRPIDVAFVGSSCTMAAINEQVVEDSFLKQTQLEWHFANIGYCRFGRNMTYVILKELLQNRKVKHVVLELRYDESWSSHPMFPYLADNETILNTPVFFNHSYFYDFYLAGVSRIECQKEKVFYKKEAYEKSENRYGHVPMIEIADTTYLEAVRHKSIKSMERKDLTILRKANLMYPLFYLRKMIQLCKAKGVDLVFLYTPFYGDAGFLPKELQTYQSYGKVLIPPADIFMKKSHWADETHLNKYGAVNNSYWFANEFAIYLESRKEK